MRYGPWFVVAAALMPSLSSRIASAQDAVGTRAEIITAPDDRAGPRFGVAVLTRGSETARKELKSFSPVTSLFGWQFEHPFDMGSEVPLRVMTELVFLVGGLEQNVPLPSATWLLALRKTNGFEFGVGPTLTLSGTQIAVAAGFTEQYGIVNVPINVAVAPARTGAAISVTAGFNLRR
ncbi:MAG TPA: hypothetical protein VFD67_01750 [Gemmatimonadaceae bacterium]|nr:hypothetical protein [Gemmatimonadaceae bacterium]